MVKKIKNYFIEKGSIFLNPKLFSLKFLHKQQRKNVWWFPPTKQTWVIPLKQRNTRVIYREINDLPQLGPNILLKLLKILKLY